MKSSSERCAPILDRTISATIRELRSLDASMDGAATHLPNLVKVLESAWDITWREEIAEAEALTDLRRGTGSPTATPRMEAQATARTVQECYSISVNIRRTISRLRCAVREAAFAVSLLRTDTIGLLRFLHQRFSGESTTLDAQSVVYAIFRRERQVASLKDKIDRAVHSLV